MKKHEILFVFFYVRIFSFHFSFFLYYDFLYSNLALVSFYILMFMFLFKKGYD